MPKQMYKGRQNTRSMSDINLNLFHSILEYLTSQQQINTLKAISFNHSLKLHCSFIKIKYSYDKFYSRSDKSYYFMLFQNKQYLKHQVNHFVSRCNNYSYDISEFLSFPRKYSIILKQCSQSIDQELRSDFVNELGVILFDPCIPMPKMFRQTVATSASSPLQNLLLSSLDNQYSLNFNEEVFEKIKEKFEEFEQIHMLQMMGNYHSACQLINYGYTINYQNRETKIVKGNKLHNLLVSLFSLVDIQLQLIYQYLRGIKDPFELFLHFNTKYQQFISSVISIEENMGNLFKLYQELYNQVFGKSVTIFCFWKHGLAMWINKMSDFHQITHNAYTNMVQQICKSKTKYLLKQNNMFILLSDQTQNEKKSFAYQLMKINENQIIILANNYQDYLVDLQISEASIVYCGHSNQQFNELFLSSERELIKKQVSFIEKLNKQSHSERSQLNKIVQERFKLFEQILKPRTLKLILKEYEAFQLKPSIIKRLISKDSSIQRYVTLLNKNKPQKLLQLNSNTAYMISKGFGQKSAPSTANSDDHSFEFYESEIDGEQQTQEINNIQTDYEKKLSQTK